MTFARCSASMRWSCDRSGAVEGFVTVWEVADGIGGRL
jgi:hypothetical protein